MISPAAALTLRYGTVAKEHCRSGETVCSLTFFLGYLRVILTIAAFALIMKHPSLAGFLYFLNSLLDSLDGHLARSFNQCENNMLIELFYYHCLDLGTKFGATFDMLIDRPELQRPL